MWEQGRGVTRLLSSVRARAAGRAFARADPLNDHHSPSGLPFSFALEIYASQSTMRLLLRSLRPLSVRSSLVTSAPTPSTLLSSSPSLASSSSSRAFSSSPAHSLITSGNVRRPRSAHKKHVRVGRGQGQQTGEGKGRGTKGQNARAGPGPHRAFQGGETPVTLQFPKRGFFNL